MGARWDRSGNHERLDRHTERSGYPIRIESLELRHASDGECANRILHISRGPFVANPASATNVMFAQVTVSETVPVYFLPILPAVGTTATVRASSTAGQITRNTLGDGLSPFSPDAHSLTDPNFGFTIGQQYTLRWPPPGQRKQGNSCSGDIGYSPSGSSDRGYVDIG